MFMVNSCFDTRIFLSIFLLINGLVEVHILYNRNPRCSHPQKKPFARSLIIQRWGVTQSLEKIWAFNFDNPPRICHGLAGKSPLRCPFTGDFPASRVWWHQRVIPFSTIFGHGVWKIFPMKFPNVWLSIPLYPHSILIQSQLKSMKLHLNAIKF